MAQNPKRRADLLDGALTVLAREGSRGLTHRAVDAEAGLPQGTCVNYFRSRDALLNAVGVRVFERLTPSPAELEARASHPPTRERLVALMHDLMARVLAQPELQLALWELRLESTRRPELERRLTLTLADALALDLAFYEQAGLPGGADAIVRLHLAFEGLILNHLTLPGVLKVAEREDLVASLVEHLVPQGRLPSTR